MLFIQFANWLEFYADALDLNVWTSTTVVNASHEDSCSKWKVTVKRSDGTERVFVVKHLVFATGFGSGGYDLPFYPEMVQQGTAPIANRY